MRQNAWISITLLCLACGLAYPQQTPQVFFDFDSTPGPWRSANEGELRVARNIGQRQGGALVVPTAFPDDAVVAIRQTMDWSGFDRLSFDVFVPKDAPRDVQAMAYVIDIDHHWFQALDRQYLERGKWTTISFDISDQSDRWQFEGHFRPWDSDVKRELQEFGIKLISKNAYQGEAAIDDIRLSRSAREARPPLQVLNFRTNTDTVSRYHKFEITFNLSRSYQNPFDPDQIDIRGHFISPGGQVTTVPGFFHRNYIRTMTAKGEDLWETLTPVGCSEWKIRFAPVEAGAYRFYVEIEDGDHLKTALRHFQVTPSKRPGFVRISKKDPRYFEFDDGSFFYPIGHNICATFDERNSANLGIDLLYHRGTLAYDRYLKGMSENRETLARIWMSAWNLALEWSHSYDAHYRGLGRYSLENAWRMDYILERAEEQGIYVAITFEPHGHWIVSIKEESDWPTNPYNVEAGGILSQPQEFFVDQRARRLYLQRLRYILARWGYSTAVFSWEIFNEIDLGHNYYKQMMATIVEWERGIARYIKANDQGKHLITSNRYWWDQAGYLYQQPEIEYTSAHLFGENPIAQAKNAYFTMLPFNKTFVISELAEDVYGGSRERTEEFMHVALWSTYMLPMASHGWPWWWDFIDEADLYFHFKALANFNDGEDRRGRNFQTATVPALTEQGAPVPQASAECLFNNQSFYAWVYDRKLIGENPEKQPLPAKLVLPIAKLQNGLYDVEFWDTYKGVVTGRTDLRITDGTARLALPTFAKDIALKVFPAKRDSRSP